MLAKLLAYGRSRPSMAEVGAHLSISGSEVHAALKRLERARLRRHRPDRHPAPVAGRRRVPHPRRQIRVPAKRGEVTRGVPTSYAGSPLNGKLAADHLPPVWPRPEGAARGVALEPLYPSAPAAALRDPALYQLLALIDAIREGRAREREAGRGRAPRTNPPIP